jgi:hypothetical protein
LEITVLGQILERQKYIKNQNDKLLVYFFYPTAKIRTHNGFIEELTTRLEENEFFKAGGWLLFSGNWKDTLLGTKSSL